MPSNRTSSPVSSAPSKRGYEAAIAEPDAALDALVSAYPETDRAVEEEGLRLLVPVWTDGVAAFGTQTAARWDAYAAWMKERGLIPADLDVAAAYSTSFLPSPAATPVATPAAG